MADCISLDGEAKCIQLTDEDISEIAYSVGLSFQTVGSVPLSKEGGDISEESLSCANVARSLITANMLLSGLKRHSVGFVAMDIL